MDIQDFGGVAMKRINTMSSAVLSTSFALALVPLFAQAPRPSPLSMKLQCAGGDCPLLRGVPQTVGMRSGFVRLKTGETVGWHTTGKNEESLIILRGSGEARIEGQPARPFAAPAFVYIPPATRHNVANTGTELLEYVYVVAPANRQASDKQPR